jgi:hypothetical protein
MTRAVEWLLHHPYVYWTAVIGWIAAWRIILGAL